MVIPTIDSNTFEYFCQNEFLLYEPLRKFTTDIKIQSFKIGSVIAQVVVWEKPDPTTKASTTTWESYTQCHLDVGPALQG
jgi:hypothetical protein